MRLVLVRHGEAEVLERQIIGGLTGCLGLTAHGRAQASALCELHPGLADGLTFREYAECYGAFDVMAEPHRPYAPEGESFSEFLQRIRDALRQLASTYAGRTVVVVSHGGFVMGSVLVTFDIPRPGSGAQLHTANTAITEWQVTDGVWTLVRFNDGAHLRALGTSS